MYLLPRTSNNRASVTSFGSCNVFLLDFLYYVFYIITGGGM